MPAPVLLGLPWLASVLTGLFGGIIAWLVQYTTRRTALVLAGTVAISAVSVAFFAGINALIDGLATVMPAPIVDGARMLAPHNVDECLTAIVAGHVAYYVYTWKVKIIQWRLI